MADRATLRYDTPMADNAESMTLEVLKSIQASIADLRQRMERVEATVVETAGIVKKQRRDIAGILVIMKATVGDFEERVTAIEERMDVFDAMKPQA